MSRRNCPTASSTPQRRGICKVLTEDKKYFKVIADVRVKLENDTALAFLCIVRETSDMYNFQQCP